MSHQGGWYRCCYRGSYRGWYNGLYKGCYKRGGVVTVVQHTPLESILTHWSYKRGGVVTVVNHTPLESILTHWSYKRGGVVTVVHHTPLESILTHWSYTRGGVVTVVPQRNPEPSSIACVVAQSEHKLYSIHPNKEVLTALIRYGYCPLYTQTRAWGLVRGSCGEGKKH